MTKNNGAPVRVDREEEWAVLMRASNAGRAGAAVDAEDIVQETLLAVHLKRQTWDETARLGPWLFAIARHKLIDALRRRGRRAELSIDEFAEVLPSADDGSSSIVADVSRHLEGLPPGQRNVVRCIAVDGASVDEAAARLKMTNGAVRVALHRGLAALAVKFRRVD